MTTFEAISTDENANYDFWTQIADLHLALEQSHAKCQDARSRHFCRQARRDRAEALSNRAKQLYLKKETT